MGKKQIDMLIIKEEVIAKLFDGTLLEHRIGNVELKSNWSQEHGKKICAFANRTLDGPLWLCVGVNDDGQLCGNTETWAKQTEEIISQHINQYLDPQPTCKSITCHNIENKWIIIIQYNNPGAVVYWNKQPYKASGTTIAPMMPEEVMALTVKLPGLSDYTSQKWMGNANDALVKEFAEYISIKRKDVPFAAITTLSTDHILERVGIKDITVSRILFGDFNYRVVHYDNENKPVKNDAYNGLFGVLSDKFIEHVQDYSRSYISTNTNPYSNLALKEAFSNAVAHAAYFENNGEIVIEIYPDKLSVSNLCIRDSEYFANKWFSRSHKTINKALMETLRLSGFVDELGRGKNLIFAESLKYGKKPPQVVLEKCGRYDRWRLYLYGGSQDKTQIKLLTRLKELYKDEHKALIANALVLWRGQPVSNIKNYIDGDSLPLLVDVLNDTRGPIFYYSEKDELVLRRWVRVLIGEGKDSKQLSAAEGKDILEFARKIRLQYDHGFVTPKDLRYLADMGDTKSEKVLSSELFKKWEKKGEVKRIRKGLYQFEQPKTTIDIKALITKILTEGEPKEN